MASESVPEPRRKQYDIHQDVTWYELTDFDVRLLNEARTLRDLPQLDFQAAGAAGAVDDHTMHLEPVPDCPVCQEHGPHIVSEEGEPHGDPE